MSSEILALNINHLLTGTYLLTYLFTYYKSPVICDGVKLRTKKDNLWKLKESIKN